MDNALAVSASEQKHRPNLNKPYNVQKYSFQNTMNPDLINNI